MSSRQVPSENPEAMSRRFIQQTPVKIGTTEEFACVTRTLRDASFNEETICSTFKLEDMSRVGSLTNEQVSEASLTPQLGLLIRLFLVLTLVQRSEVEDVLGRDAINSFLSLGLVGFDDSSNQAVYARVLVYPVAGLLIASDRHSLPDGSSFDPPPDLVFPAIFGGTLEFLRLLPRTWKGTALDLCSGTGIAAFVLSRSGNPAFSSDITERAAMFARFNCALNNIDNVEVVSGDLYEAVADRSFGCIVAHPPYVPSLEEKEIWRDGGILGESLVKRIIEGLPQRLNPGGTFFCISLGIDTEKARFEDRVRSWLGASADRFDLVFSFKEEREPRLVLQSLLKKRPEWGADTLTRFESEFQHEGVVNMPLGALCLRRLEETETRQPLTVRTKLSARTEGSDFERAFDFHKRRSRPDFLETLKLAKPRLSPALELKVTHVVHEGALVPADFVLEIDKPFDAKLRLEGWMASMLVRLDGETSLAQIYEEFRENDAIPKEFALENFAVLVAGTLELGYTLLE